MILSGRRAPFLLFFGDIVALVLSLYITLWMRYGTLPSASTLAPYGAPFTFLFALWTLVFYSSGLYGKRFILFPSRLPNALLKTHLANIILAAIFFFFVPIFGIAPKTILVLYLVVSLVCIFVWRLALYPRLSTDASQTRAVLCATGPEAEELFAEVNGNPRYGIAFCGRDLSHTDTTLVVADAAHIDTVPFTTLVRERKQLVTFEDMYEEVFDRVPLSQLEHAWFSEHVASVDSPWYAFSKRGIDIVGGLLMGVITLIAIPFIFIANAFEGRGPLFIAQERFGRYGTRIIVYKFRSMQKNFAASGAWTREHEAENRVTRVGSFLRKTSLDEFPQFINILRGELSLIGPRNDILGLGQRLAEALPYYEVRYVAKPGITGWAQVNQQYEPGNASPQSIEETKMRLAYDFYYLKHRSLGLDIVIALKTIKKMFFRVSSW